MTTIDLDRFRDVDLVIDKANDNFIAKQWTSTGDKEGRTLTVMITDGGTVGELVGATVSLLWTNKANGLTDETAFVLKDKATSTFTIEYPNNMLTPGTVIAQIRIWYDGKVVSTKPFEIEVGGIAGQMAGVVKQQEFGLLTAVLADSNKFRTDIEGLGIVKADKTYVDSMLASIAQGGPRELFYSLAALKAKYPIGADGTYLVFDSTTTDGAHSYMWDATDNAWKDLGIYQAAIIENKSIGIQQLTKDIRDDITKWNTVDFSFVAGGWNDNGSENNTDYGLQNYKRLEISVTGGDIVKFALNVTNSKKFLLVNSSGVVTDIQQTSETQYDIYTTQKTVKLKIQFYASGSIVPTITKAVYSGIASKNYADNKITEYETNFKNNGTLYNQIVKSQNLPEAMQIDISKPVNLGLTFVTGGWYDDGSENNSTYALENYVRTEYSPTDFQKGRVYQLNGGWSASLKIIRTFDKNNVLLETLTSENTRQIIFTPSKLTAKIKIQVQKSITPMLSHFVYDSIASKDYVQNTIDSSLAIESLPEYWQTYLVSKVSEINDAMVSKTGDAFIFITDTHWKDNVKLSPLIIDYLLKNTTLNKVIFGGDIVTAYGGKEDMINQVFSHNESFKRFVNQKDWFPIMGNHDFTIRDNSTSETGATLTRNQTYNLITGQTRYITDANKNIYYFVDNESEGIRYIFINCQDAEIKGEDVGWGLSYNISQEQVDWLLNVATDTDKNLCFIGHIPAEASMPSYSPKMDIIHKILSGLQDKSNLDYTDSFGVTAKKDLSNRTSTVLGYFCGHNHKDISVVSNGVRYVSLGCDSFYNDDPNVTRVKGTTSEQLISVVILNDDVVKILRVGAGTDREI